MTNKSHELGKEGEKMAVEYLLEKGYIILEKNWRYLKAEVDIIAQINEVLVIVEVKTRSSDYWNTPEKAVGYKKINMLMTAIDYYVQKKDMDVEVRFDIIAIIKNKKAFYINHIENAFNSLG
ncbi:MAG: YraN family protein [Flavobacteriaceae bacterium]|nr:YraN family protein [Flavobacteriaceae bacterium]